MRVYQHFQIFCNLCLNHCVWQRWSPEGFPSGESEENLRGRKRFLLGCYSGLVTSGTEYLPWRKLDPDSQAHVQEAAKYWSVKKRKDSFKEWKLTLGNEDADSGLSNFHGDFSLLLKQWNKPCLSLTWTLDICWSALELLNLHPFCNAHFGKHSQDTGPSLCKTEDTPMEPLAHSTQAAAVVHTNSGRKEDINQVLS